MMGMQSAHSTADTRIWANMVAVSPGCCLGMIDNRLS